jgi:hypothetical protein
MNERLRQRYLKQMGFTPWVAVTALPGAAPSAERYVDIDDDDSAHQVAAVVAEAPVAAEKADNQSAPVLPVPSAPSLNFTLQAHRGSDVHLWVEQQQADAPGLNREEQQQLAALLKLFGGTVQSDPKRLVCSATAGKPMTADIARPMFELFLRRLLGRDTTAKLLLCASDSTVQALFGSDRYQPLLRDQITILPVSTLTEMLSDPAGHKRSSWQAMRDHGFA